jgi:mxaK protein
MKRRVVHLAFAAVTAVLVAGALQAGAEWWRARVDNAAIAAAGHATSAGQPPADLPAARLAQANVLSRAGRDDDALRLYNTLIPRGQPDAIAQAALYNLGNMFLRRGRELGGTDAFQAQAMVELGKQRYRDLLRANPDDWDARYNLERALWLAPELQDMFGEENTMPKETVRVRVPGLPPGDLP